MKYLDTSLMNIDLTSENPDFMSTSTYANVLYTDSQKSVELVIYTMYRLIYKVQRMNIN